jgi:hypothetical protein
VSASDSRDTGGVTPDTTGGPDVDAVVRHDFWLLVGIGNAALLCLSLGPMLVAFRGRLVAGGAVFAAGLLALAGGGHRYRRARHRLDRRDADGSTGGSAPQSERHPRNG